MVDNFAISIIFDQAKSTNSGEHSSLFGGVRMYEEKKVLHHLLVVTDGRAKI
jgi:hypothetical protein